MPLTTMAQVTTFSVKATPGEKSKKFAKVPGDKNYDYLYKGGYFESADETIEVIQNISAPAAGSGGAGAPVITSTKFSVTDALKKYSQDKDAIVVPDQKTADRIRGWQSDNQIKLKKALESYLSPIILLTGKIPDPKNKDDFEKTTYNNLKEEYVSKTNPYYRLVDDKLLLTDVEPTAGPAKTNLLSYVGFFGLVGGVATIYNYFENGTYPLGVAVLQKAVNGITDKNTGLTLYQNAITAHKEIQSSLANIHNAAILLSSDNPTTKQSWNKVGTSPNTIYDWFLNDTEVVQITGTSKSTNGSGGTDAPYTTISSFLKVFAPYDIVNAEDSEGYKKRLDIFDVFAPISIASEQRDATLDAGSSGQDRCGKSPSGVALLSVQTFMFPLCAMTDLFGQFVDGLLLSGANIFLITSGVYSQSNTTAPETKLIDASGVEVQNRFSQTPQNFFVGLLPKEFRTPFQDVILDDTSEIGKAIISTSNALRNVLNALMAVAFIGIAFANILQIQVKNYNIRQLVPGLIIGYVLALSSTFLIRGALEATSFATKAVYEEGSRVAARVAGRSGACKDVPLGETGQNDLSTCGVQNMVTAFSNVRGTNGRACLTYTDNGISCSGDISLGAVTQQGFLNFAVLVAAVLFTVLAFMMIVRVVVFSMLIPLSPVAVLSAYIPPLKKPIWDRWYALMSKWLLMPIPVAGTIIAAVIYFASANVNPGGEVGILGFLLHYIVGIVFLYGAVKVPFQFTGELGSYLKKAQANMEGAVKAPQGWVQNRGKDLAIKAFDPDKNKLFGAGKALNAGRAVVLNQKKLWKDRQESRNDDFKDLFNNEKIDLAKTGLSRNKKFKENVGSIYKRFDTARQSLGDAKKVYDGTEPAKGIKEAQENLVRQMDSLAARRQALLTKKIQAETLDDTDTTKAAMLEEVKQGLEQADGEFDILGKALTELQKKDADEFKTFINKEENPAEWRTSLGAIDSMNTLIEKEQEAFDRAEGDYKRGLAELMEFRAKSHDMAMSERKAMSDQKKTVLEDMVKRTILTDKYNDIKQPLSPLWLGGEKFKTGIPLVGGVLDSAINGALGWANQGFVSGSGYRKLIEDVAILREENSLMSAVVTDRVRAVGNEARAKKATEPILEDLKTRQQLVGVDSERSLNRSMVNYLKTNPDSSAVRVELEAAKGIAAEMVPKQDGKTSTVLQSVLQSYNEPIMHLTQAYASGDPAMVEFDRSMGGLNQTMKALNMPTGDGSMHSRFVTKVSQMRAEFAADIAAGTPLAERRQKAEKARKDLEEMVQRKGYTKSDIEEIRTTNPELAQKLEIEAENFTSERKKYRSKASGAISDEMKKLENSPLVAGDIQRYSKVFKNLLTNKGIAAEVNGDPMAVATYKSFADRITGGKIYGVEAENVYAGLKDAGVFGNRVDEHGNSLDPFERDSDGVLIGDGMSNFAERETLALGLKALRTCTDEGRARAVIAQMQKIRQQGSDKDLMRSLRIDQASRTSPESLLSVDMITPDTVPLQDIAVPEARLVGDANLSVRPCIARIGDIAIKEQVLPKKTSTTTRRGGLTSTASDPDKIYFGYNTTTGAYYEAKRTGDTFEIVREVSFEQDPDFMRKIKATTGGSKNKGR